ncbi:hypothetical protein ACFL47_02540 [Candidatus Latescibacterota bacterium]
MTGEKKKSMWGGRFSDNPDTFMLKFGASIEVDIELLDVDIEGSIAWTETERDYYIESIKKIIPETELLHDKRKAIHRGHTLHLMRLCARNANPDTSIRELSAELSALADAVVVLCLESAAEELYTRIDIDNRQHSLVVLGLGKLGGYELNVSSDIDLLFLCRESDEMWGQYDSITFHIILAEKLAKLLSDITEQGAMYRVDTRLRADGASGPLVRTVSDYLRYLELRGESWERQMLLKARAIAGDVTVADTFLKAVEHFIYPSGITRSPNREIVAIKNQIERRMHADGSKKTHVKLMEGGIRDIEFIVQCLQLLMGGIHPEVQVTGTPDALEELHRFDAINEYEFETLIHAYILYRRLENALQWRELLPVFSIPDDAVSLTALEMFIGLDSGNNKPGTALNKDIETTRQKVRAIFNEVFSAEGYGSFEDMALYTANANEGDEKTHRFLESQGFGDPGAGARNIAGLVFEHNIKGTGRVLHRSAQKFLPVLLKTLSELPDPDGALERFLRVVESYGARYTLFDILSTNTPFLELLTSITHGSVFVTDIIISDPSLLDWLFETEEILNPLNRTAVKREMKRIEGEQTDGTSFTGACLKLKNREKLRIGARDISGFSSTRETLAELTAVAEAIVGSVYNRTLREMTVTYPLLKRDYDFAVIAAGRLGAEAMNFGSDLDLIFVYRASGTRADSIEIPEISVEFARRILAYLTGGGGANKIYDVDARLRPEGGNSVLTISLDSFRQYLQRRGSVWERLAHTRSRIVAGGTDLGKDIGEVITGFVYGEPFTFEEISKIREIRRAMIDNSLKRHKGLTNIKSGPGGIVDIDFIAQSYAAHYGAGNADLQRRETPSILEALGAQRIIDRHDTATLIDLHTFLSDAEKAIRISSGKSINTVPKPGAELMRLARLLGFKNARRFHKRLDDVTGLTKEYHDRLMGELEARSGDGASQ